MKLRLSMLERVIDLPSKDLGELRQLFDDVGLEVKGIDTERGDTTFTIETLANRGDHLSALGAARELSARLLQAIKLPPVVASFDDRKASVPVRRNTPKCLRYALLEMVLPKGMQLRSDVASIIGEHAEPRHPIVDILNYILLEIGQPMHAFDRDKIDGEISADLLEKAEEIVALDGKTYQVPVGSLVIRDRKKIVAVAGVIGCQNSMVTLDTTRVLIESASFDPVSVRITARAMGLKTDASYTFERGCDVDGAVFGLKRLAHLTGGSGAVKDANSAQILGFTYSEGEPTEKRKVLLDIEKIREEMNLPRLAEVEITTRLKHLGYFLEPTGEELKYNAIVPSWRLWDIRNPEDLTEEFARAHGFNKVKLELPPLDYETPELDVNEVVLSRLEPALHGSGFREVITKGFYSGEEARLLEELQPGIEAKHLRIQNAVESNYSHMKMTNILHLVRVCEEARRFGVQSAKVYEFGRLFTRESFQDQRYEFERDVITLAASGRWNDHSWRKPESFEAVGAYFKGALECMFAGLGLQATVTSGKHPFLHPGQQSELRVGRTECGFFGAVHPLILERLDSKLPILYAELDMAKLSKVMKDLTYRQPSDLPSVWRDLTLKLPVRELAGNVTRWMHDAKPENLASVEIVDDFRRQEEDFRRVSFRLVFQSEERTLSNTEVDTEMGKILAALKSEHSLELAA